MTELVQYLHPDALYDEPYRAVPLVLDSYASLNGDVALVDEGPAFGVLAFGDRRVRVDAVADGILRVRFGFCGQAGTEPSATEVLGLVNTAGLPAESLFRRKTADRWIFGLANLRLELEPRKGEWTLTRADGTVLWQTVEGGFRFSSKEPEYGGQRVFCKSMLCDNEHIFGFGGRIASCDRRGQSVDIFSVKTGKRSGDYGGFPLPYFISTKGWGLFVNNPWPHVYFDMGRTDPGRWWMHAPGGDCDVFLMDGPTFGDVVRRYTSLTGRIPEIPRWMLGFWCSSLTFDNGPSSVADARQLRQQGYPCDVFVFDGPWRGGSDFASVYQAIQDYPSNDLEWHPDFGDGPRSIKELDTLGIKTVLHLNSRNFRDSTAETAVTQGLLRRHGDEVVARVTHDEGERYYRGLLEPRVADGVAAWWTDHADRVSGELAPGIPSRNLFGPLWNQLLVKIMDDHGKPSHPSLSRGGGIGSQRYAIPWPGDTRCGLDALADDIWFMLNAGLAGFALTSVDLGGFCLSGDPAADYVSERARHAEMFDDENLSRRLCQFLLFTPVPRIHNNLETAAKLPWNCSDQIRSLYRQALEERYRLTPYLYSYIVDSARTGEPLLRPLVYHHPDDPVIFDWPTQFYLGEHLLVSPVTREKTTRWRVYLPKGSWTHLWSGARFEGGTVANVPAPLYSMTGLPVFVRDGAIVVRQPVTQSLGNRIPDTLDIDLYPGNDETTFDLHETSASTSKIHATRERNRVAISMQNNTEIERTYRVAVHTPDQPGRVVHSKLEVPPYTSRRAAIDLN